MGYLQLVAPLLSNTPLRQLHRARSKFGKSRSTISEKCVGLVANSVNGGCGGSNDCNYPPYHSARKYSVLHGSLMRRRSTACWLYSQPLSSSTSSLSWTRKKYRSESGRAYSNFSVSSRSITSLSTKDNEDAEGNTGRNEDPLRDKSKTAPVSGPNEREDDRYYYLIKQKYSPSRHQKYRPSGVHGTLEMTVSNKPLKERIIQSYTDIVAYFMPKGARNLSPV